MLEYLLQITDALSDVSLCGLRRQQHLPGVLGHLLYGAFDHLATAVPGSLARQE
jgi:hypothetical protein